MVLREILRQVRFSDFSLPYETKRCYFSMNIFESVVKNGLSIALKSVGEDAQIGNTKFTASFDESEMAVSRNTYGDEDEVTTTATLLKAALTSKPTVGQVLTRGTQRYVILTVQEDAQSYEIGLRAKDG